MVNDSDAAVSNAYLDALDRPGNVKPDYWILAVLRLEKESTAEWLSWAGQESGGLK